jgi:steroid delta-isomerase-like uncharacterized protein
MQAQTLIQLEEKLYREGDWDAIGDVYTEDVEFTSPDGSVIRGRDQVADYFRREAEAFSDTTFSQELIAADGDLAVVTWSWSGTHSKDLTAPSGQTLSATGNRISMDAVSICRIRDGRIASMRRYYDRLDMMMALGVITPAGTSPG